MGQDASTSKQIMGIPAKQFSTVVCDVKRANVLATRFQQQGNSLRFQILDHKDNNTFLIWKNVVRVCCSYDSEMPQKIMNLKQFYYIYHKIWSQTPSNPSTPVKPVNERPPEATDDDCFTSPEVTASNEGTEEAVAPSLPHLESFGDEECSICMERADPSNSIALNCSHGPFCADCLRRWNVQSHTCPMCRADNGDEDSWVLTDTPLPEDYTGHLFAYVKSLPDYR